MNFIIFTTYVRGIVCDLIEQCIAQTPDVWEWTDEVAAYCLSHDPNPNPTSSPTPYPNPNLHNSKPNPDQVAIIGGIINRKSGGNFYQVSE